jgi:predicted enzyme related to lactoylglutathione lyase
MAEKRYVGPGKFVWHELLTGDVDKAAEYYSRLFNWTFKDIERGGPHPYRCFGKDGVDFGGIVPLDPSRGEEPHWIPYVTVEDVDGLLEHMGKLGGTVMAGPAELPDFGRCLMVKDPTGAPVVLHSGGDPDEELGDDPPAPGKIIWNDLLSRDPLAAGRFYCGVFGWELFTMDMEAQGTYYLLRRGEINEAGILLKPESAEGSSSWLPYVAVADLNLACVEAAHHGGAIHLPPTDLHGAGTFAVISDPTGGVLALFQPGPAQQGEP